MKEIEESKKGKKVGGKESVRENSKKEHGIVQIREREVYEVGERN